MIIELLNWIGLDPATCLYWIFGISITLFVLDIFFQTELITWGALVLFSTYLTLLVEHYTDMSTLWSVLLFCAILGIFIYIYCTVWRKFVKALLEKTLMRNAAKEQTERASGQTGIFRKISGSYFVELEGELWQASCDSEPLSAFSDQDEVSIIKCDEGAILFKRK